MKKYVFIIIALLAFHASAKPTFGKNGIVVSASDLASQAGIEVLKIGGSAADGAVATAFALAVTRPYYGSLGGGGLMLTRFNGEVLALDHRERAPEKATADMYSKGQSSEIGGLAVATPGNVAGLYELHKKYGRLPWQRDIEPALRLAEQGFMVTEELARTTKEVMTDFSKAGVNFFKNKRAELQVGDNFKQPQLAKAFRLIMKNGADGFYKGAVARDIVSTAAQEKGILSYNDLKNYKASWTKPLKAQVFGATVYSMPPPSSGGALLLAELKMAEKLKLQNEKPYSGAEFHILAEIMSRAFFDRQYLADPKYTSFPADELYSEERVNKWIETINPKKKQDFDPAKFEIKTEKSSGHEKGNTTHYVVVDHSGNVVSATTTLNGDYGSAVVTKEYGIVLNNEMDDFTTQPGKPNIFGLIQGKANDIAPNKTPLSSMTPTIIEKDNQFWMAIGSPGGPKIINAVFQVVLRALNTPLDMDELIQQPRIHHQFKPDKIFVDRTLSPDTQRELEKRGHILTEGIIARVYAVRKTSTGLLEGAYDNRHEGGAAGY